MSKKKNLQLILLLPLVLFIPFYVGNINVAAVSGPRFTSTPESPCYVLMGASKTLEWHAESVEFNWINVDIYVDNALVQSYWQFVEGWTISYTITIPNPTLNSKLVRCHIWDYYGSQDHTVRVYPETGAYAYTLTKGTLMTGSEPLSATYKMDMKPDYLWQNNKNLNFIVHAKQSLYNQYFYQYEVDVSFTIDNSYNAGILSLLINMNELCNIPDLRIWDDVAGTISVQIIYNNAPPQTISVSAGDNAEYMLKFIYGKEINFVRIYFTRLYTPSYNLVQFYLFIDAMYIYYTQA